MSLHEQSAFVYLFVLVKNADISKTVVSRIFLLQALNQVLLTHIPEDLRRVALKISHIGKKGKPQRSPGGTADVT